MDSSLKSNVLSNIPSSSYQSNGSNSSDQEHSLILSIEEYKTQLDEVHTAIQSASEEDKVQLQELQLNLINILELTLNQLAQSQSQKEKSKEELKPSSCNENQVEKSIDDEFERFKLEIAKLDGVEEKPEKEAGSSSAKLNDLESSLRSLEGENVRVPFMERWGGFSYHNAIVFSLVYTENHEIDYENPEVLVLFSQPTSLSMLPCRYFLDDRCNYEAGTCKYSHGKRVAVSELKEYTDPDHDSIVAGSKVLALHEGQEVWHRGSVEDVLEGRAGFSLNCSVCAKVIEVALEAMIPLFADEDGDSEETPDEEDVSAGAGNEASEEPETNFVPSEAWLKNPLSTKLGEWEKHTKGIGSKLLAQMGYIVGTGLGPKGEGRVDPVTAYVYPQGKSLDHCMHLRQSSNGANIYEVEKRLLNEQKKEEGRRKAQGKALQSRTSVFDIINNKLSDKRPDDVSAAQSPKQELDVSKPSLKKNSNKELNLKNFQLSSRIDKLKAELKTLKMSRSRQSKDSVTIKSIDAKLRDKMQELSSLEKAEKQVESEQRNRKNMQKLCSF